MKISIELDPNEEVSEAIAFLQGLNGGAAKAEAPAEAEAPAPAPKKAKKAKGPTKDDVRNALKAFAGENGHDAAVAILNKVGEAKSLSSLDSSKFQAVLDSIEAGGVGGEEEEEDDFS